MLAKLSEDPGKKLSWEAVLEKFFVKKGDLVEVGELSKPKLSLVLDLDLSLLKRGGSLVFLGGRKIGPVERVGIDFSSRALIIERSDGKIFELSSARNELPDLGVFEKAQATLENTKSCTPDECSSFETGRGSKYFYEDSGNTVRHKIRGAKVECNEPQDLMVFFPEDKVDHSRFLDARAPYNPGEKVYVYDESGNQVTSNEQAARAKKLYVGILDVKANRVTDYEEATLFPTLGYHTFDQRCCEDVDSGERRRESHIGSPVTKIIKKDGTVLQ